MSDQAICRRYAAALHAEAEAGGVVDRVDEDVAATKASLAESRELQLLFSSPVISVAKKRSIIEKLFSNRVADIFLRFLLLLNQKGRGEMIDGMLEEYRALRNRQQGIVEAETRSAMPLSKEQIEALSNRLSELSGADVHLTVSEDPSLLGGVIVKLGDTVYDGSLRRQLSVLRAQLKGEGLHRN